MRIDRILLGLFLAVSGISTASAEETVIGRVVRCEGTCTGASAGAPESVTGGDAVRLKERLATAPESRLELTFDDGTNLKVGEKADIVLDEFVYDPKGGNRFRAAIAGPFRYVSGKLAAGAMREASITTPFAVIGVRGTDFWGGPIGGVNGVVLFEGSVTVTTPAGSVVLEAPRDGTNIVAPGAPPGAVAPWADDRIAAALATVTFP